MAENETNTHPISAQPSPTERVAETQNTCPHSIPMCPVCRATDELLRIVRAPRARWFGFFRFGVQ